MFPLYARRPPWPYWYQPESGEEAEEFHKAREDVRCWLVATGKGCVNFAKLDRLMEAAGVQVDFEKFRFKNFCEFLFHCQDFIEVRMYKPEIVPYCKSRFLFLKPEGVKANMAHVDRLVQGQRVEIPKYKKNGNPIPTYTNTNCVPPRMLISGLRAPEKPKELGAPLTSGATGTTISESSSTGVSKTSGATGPTISGSAATQASLTSGATGTTFSGSTATAPEMPKEESPLKKKEVAPEISRTRAEPQTSSKVNGISHELKLKEWFLRIELAERSGVLVTVVL